MDEFQLQKFSFTHLYNLDSHLAVEQFEQFQEHIDRYNFEIEVAVLEPGLGPVGACDVPYAEVVAVLGGLGPVGPVHTVSFD